MQLMRGRYGADAPALRAHAQARGARLSLLPARRHPLTGPTPAPQQQQPLFRRSAPLRTVADAATAVEALVAERQPTSGAASVSVSNGVVAAAHSSTNGASAAQPQPPPPPRVFKGHVLVVGAGPVGLVSALHFLRAGYRVTVAERRTAPAPSAAERPNLHSYPMALSPRAVAAIAAAGAAPPLLTDGSPFVGTVSGADGRELMSLAPEADGDGAAARQAREPGRAAEAWRSHLVDQVGLSRQLAAEARRLYPRETGAFALLGGRELVGVDFGAREAAFRVRRGAAAAAAGGVTDSAPGSIDEIFGTNGHANGNGNGHAAAEAEAAEAAADPYASEEFYPETIRYDFLVGADGASSAVRAQMEAALPHVRSRTLLASGKTYKTFLVPAAEGAASVPGLATDAPRRHLYVWGGALSGKRGGGGGGGGKGKGKKLRAPRVVAYKREDGMLAGMIMVDDPEAGWAPGAVAAALAEHHPLMPAAWVDRIEAQAAARPPSSFGRIVSVSRLDGPRAVLVGDAAHAITSSLGQGCNTGVDSAAALAAALERCGGDLDALPAAYNKARQPDVRAMQKLELMSVLATPGCTNGNFLQRAFARAVLISATVLGLLLARKKARPAAAGQRGGSSGGGADSGSKMHTVHVRTSPPWMTQLRDPGYSPRDVLRGVYGLAALAAALVAAAATAIAKGLYLLLAIMVGA